MSKEIEWLRKLKSKPSKDDLSQVVPNDKQVTAEQKHAAQTSTPDDALVSEMKGFKAIAGMDSLKSLITESFINVIRNPVQAKLYGVSVPNILLYGPAGCGKTYFAERVAEEVGINFMRVSPDDLASPYLHGTQAKIGELFKRAEAMAPTLLFFDEFDCMVPKRTNNPDKQYQADEVNEFLTMLNNTSQRGIYVIAATNRPDNIDSSVMRTGRIDEKIYIPMPDKEARATLFRYELNSRPAATDISYNTLAELSQGYNCSDISYIVKTAARNKFNNSILTSTKSPITQSDLEYAIANTCPSVSEKDLRAFERIIRDISPQSHERRMYKVGF